MAIAKRSPAVDKWKLVQAAYKDSRLDSNAKHVLAVLASFHNSRTGRLDPGYDKIAKCASLGRSTVIRAISLLVQAGYVTVTHRPLKRGNKTNTYDLAAVYPVNESTTATAETATGEVVSERDHPSATAGPPTSATAGPKLTEVLEQSERTKVPPLRHPPSSLNPGASVENIRLEAQAQPQQATSRDVACLQGGDGQAQAERQHLESRDGAEKEQAVPQRQLRVFGQFDAGKPKQVKLDVYVNMLGGDVEAWTYLDDTLKAISEKHGCTSEMARRTLATKAIGARSGPELHRRLDAFTVPDAAAA